MIRRIISLYFEYLQDNPAYAVNLLPWENLNEGRYIRDIDLSHLRSGGWQTLVSSLLFTFSCFSNRHTMSELLHIQINDKQQIDNRLENMIVCS